MKLVDLTHPIDASTPVFPGSQPVQVMEASTITADGYAEKRICLDSHTGTHMDAPAHMLSHSQTLDTFAISDFYGKAVLADLRSASQSDIGLEQLTPYAQPLKKTSFLVLRTGWAERWGSDEYFHDFPALTAQAAEWLVVLGIRGIGIDAISIDRMESTTFPIHHILFKAGVFVIENLTNLDGLGQEFSLGCFPLKIKDADGAPARVVAFIEE